MHRDSWDAPSINICSPGDVQHWGRVKLAWQKGGKKLMLNFVNTTETRRWDDSFSVVPTWVVCQPWPCRPFISSRKLRIVLQNEASSALEGLECCPGTARGSRKGSECSEIGENQMLLFHMAAQIAASRSLARHRMDEWVRKDRKRQRKGRGRRWSNSGMSRNKFLFPQCQENGIVYLWSLI